MRILGIDCGTERTGYGIIESDGKRHRMITAGVIRTSSKDPLPDRLLAIAKGLRSITAQYAPESAAVEEVFHAVNVKTALKLAHVRGTVMLCIAEANIPLGEYSPNRIKSSVVGFGKAEKNQVQMMVQSLLRLPEMLESEDASDALAVAICHATFTFYEQVLPRAAQAGLR